MTGYFFVYLAIVGFILLYIFYFTFFAVVLFRTDRFLSVVIKLAKKVQNLM